MTFSVCPVFGHFAVCRPVHTSMHMDALCTVSVSSVDQADRGEIPNAAQWRSIFSEHTSSLELITSTEIWAQFCANKKFTEPVFIKPVTVTLVGAKTFSLKDVSTDPLCVTARLPTFSEACSGEVCDYGLHFKNAGGADFACPATSQAGEQTGAACFVGMYAVKNGGSSKSMHTVRYVQQCTGYLKPGAAECAVRATAEQCAFGLGDSCRRCPEGAWCVGGADIRAFPGYYVQKSDRLEVQKCHPPSTERCVGNVHAPTVNHAPAVNIHAPAVNIHALAVNVHAPAVNIHAA